MPREHETIGSVGNRESAEFAHLSDDERTEAARALTLAVRSRYIAAEEARREKLRKQGVEDDW